MIKKKIDSICDKISRKKAPSLKTVTTGSNITVSVLDVIIHTG